LAGRATARDSRNDLRELPGPATAQARGKLRTVVSCQLPVAGSRTRARGPQAGWLLESNQHFMHFAWRRRDGRVAEGARLESVFTRKGNVGSNPTLSASSSVILQPDYCLGPKVERQK